MRLFTLFFALAAFIGAFAQGTDPDTRLQNKFSPAQLKSMDEGRVAYWNYYLENSFEIMDIVEEKAAYLNELEEIEIDIETFHGLTLNLDEYHQKGAYLKIKGHEKMLVVKSMTSFIEEFNTFYQTRK